MCVTAAKLGTSDGVLIKNIVLFSVLIYELVGPLLTKWALTKAGDIKPSGENVQERRTRKYQEALGQNTISEAGRKQAQRNIERRKKQAAKEN